MARGRHRAPGPRVAVNVARIAVGGLVLAEITVGLPAIPAHASESIPVVLAASHHSTKHHPKRHHHSAKHAPTRPAVHVAAHEVPVTQIVSAPVVPVAQVATAPESAAGPQMLFDHYIVQPGDTLTHIAAAYGVPYEVMWSLNSDTTPHPDSLFAGQRLRLPA